jgi:hypothetical protein
MAGRRNRVVISCVSFETVYVTNPIGYYQATRAHLIRCSGEPGSDEEADNNELFEKLCEHIRDNCPDIVEHNANVFDYSEMLRTVFSIIEYENRRPDPSDIYVNLSAGSAEYVAAATVASMMFPETVPFSMPRDDSTADSYVTFARLECGMPIVSTQGVGKPKPIGKYAVSIPERHLVDGLRILSEMEKKNHYPKGSEMIPLLKERGIWYRGELTEEGPEDDKRKRIDSVYYQRDFISIWADKGWVKKDKLKKRYVLTEEGRSVVDTFYVEEVGFKYVQGGGPGT